MTPTPANDIAPVALLLAAARRVVEGERMILVPPEVEINGVKVTRELAWERISPVSL